MEPFIEYEGAISFQKVLLSDIKPFMDEYKSGLDFYGNSFMSHLQSRANHFMIIYKDRKIGIMAIFEKSLSLLYIRPQYKFLDRQIFKNVLQEFEIESGYSLSWDHHTIPLFTEFQDSVQVHAYQFQLLDPRLIKTPMFNLKVRLATMTDEEIIKEMDFLKNPGSYIKKQEVWITSNDEGKAVGLGLIQPMQFSDEALDIGVFTDHSSRRTGIGSSTLAILMKMVTDSGRTPVAGCSAKNPIGRRTLESAGMTCIGSIFKYTFKK